MAANNQDQHKQQRGTSGNKESVGNKQTSQDNNNKQLGRLESQPGNMSGVNIEGQRSRKENQDLGSRGTDGDRSEKL